MESRLEHNHQVMVLPSGILLFQCDVFKSSDIVESEVANSYSFASIFIIFFLRVRVTFSYVTVNPIHSSCLCW